MAGLWNLEVRRVGVLRGSRLPVGPMILPERPIGPIFRHQHESPMGNAETLLEIDLQTTQPDRRVEAPGSQVIRIDHDLEHDEPLRYRPVRLPTGRARAQSSQVVERVDPAAMAVAPDKIDGVPTDRRRLRDLDLTRLQNRPGEDRQARSGSGGSLFALVVAQGAGTRFPQQIKGVHALVAILPANAHLAPRAAHRDVSGIRRSRGTHPIVLTGLRISNWRLSIVGVNRQSAIVNRQSISISTHAAIGTKSPFPLRPAGSSPCRETRWRGLYDRAPPAD